MAQLHPYLNFNGNAEEAFTFYKAVFGGEFSNLQRFGEVPAGTPSPGSADKILHVALPVGKNSTLMGSDIPENYERATFGTNYFISISTDTKEEADKIFNGLKEGGIIKMPLETTFWGAYFGMVTDKFNINWMISFENHN